MNKRLIIINAKVIFPDSIKEGFCIVCENGKITNIETISKLQFNDNDQIIDAKKKYLSPGFIDIHTHGGGGFDFMDGTVEAYLRAAETHIKYGTTSLLPTTLTSTTEELMNTFAVYKEAVKQNKKGASFLGLHLEGPYFSYNQRGAQDPKYLRNPKPEEYNRILEASSDIVRWSLAPELEGALEFGEILQKRNILPSIAHSDAIYEEVLKAYEKGFTHITHLYSGMSTITRKNAFRYAGVVESAYLIDDMTVEIIADGVHLPKSLLQFVYKFKGADKTALCTDSMRGAGMPDGKSILGSIKNGQEVIIEDGVAKLPDRTAFAGSVATADRLVRTMVMIAEIPLVDAIKMITATPAKIMNIHTHKGFIEIGKDADLVIFDKNINVTHTIIEGNVIYGN
ncbi:N-acetylglucosamine-6-phosphate deacetylase [uncultured Paludibacter sp.]|nr:N-acetylglucosamine-6-phosphate deacetylase [uncultured Paludibacter sp.]